MRGLARLKIQYSQKQLSKSSLAQEIRRIILFCLPKARQYRQGLLVKIMFYTDKDYQTDWRGNYRCAYKHGLYDKEWDAGASSVITLKIGQQAPADKILYLIAHEIGHHISWIKDRKFGEKKADKIANKLITRFNAK